MLIKINIAVICTVGEGLAPPASPATQLLLLGCHRRGGACPSRTSRHPTRIKYETPRFLVSPRPSSLVSFTLYPVPCSLYPVPCTLESQYTKPSPARQVSVVFPFRVVYNEI